MKKIMYFLMDITGTRIEIARELFNAGVKDAAGDINDFGYWLNERKDIAETLHYIASDLSNYGRISDKMKMRQIIYNLGKDGHIKPVSLDPHPEHQMD